MSRLLSNAVLTLVLGGLCVGALVGFNRLAAPEARILPPKGVTSPDYAAIVSAVTDEALGRDLGALCAGETRFSGTKGCDAAADHIRDSLRKLGYSVIEQPFHLAVPHTRLARIADESGKEIAGIRLHPLLPNWFRTATTPPEGLRGKVCLGDKGLAREFKSVDLRGNFVLLPLGTPWTTVAGMGAKTVLYFDDGRKAVPARWEHHVDASLNVPRFLVTGDVRSAGSSPSLPPSPPVGRAGSGAGVPPAIPEAGKMPAPPPLNPPVDGGKEIRPEGRTTNRTVTITAAVDFAERPVRNVVALLDAPGSECNASILLAPTESTRPPSRRQDAAAPAAKMAAVQGEAVVIHTHYDSYSYAPDLAPGAQQACGAAALLAVARQLAAEKAQLTRSVVLVATAGHGQGLAGIREFIRAVGTREARADAERNAVAEREAARIESDAWLGASHVAYDPHYWAAKGERAEEAYWAQSRWSGRLHRQRLKEAIAEALDRELMAAAEEVTQRRVDWVRDGQPVRDPFSPNGEAKSFLAYDAARRRQLRIQAMLATPPGKLKEQWAREAEEMSLGLRVLSVIYTRMTQWGDRAEEAELRAKIARALAPYPRLLFVGLDLTARSGRLGLVCGEPAIAKSCIPADAEVAAQFLRAAAELQKADPKSAYAMTKRGQPRFVNLVREGDAKDLPFCGQTYGAPLGFESLAALWAGYPALTLATLDDGRERMGTPSDTLDALLAEAGEGEAPAEPPRTRRNGSAGASPSQDGSAGASPSHLAVATRLIAAAASQWARGHGRIVPIARASDLYTVRGEVVSQVGDSLTPNHPMPGALVRFGPVTVWGAPRQDPPGVGSDVMVMADWRGRFELPAVWPTALSSAYWAEIDIDAAVARPQDGELTWALSTPKSGLLGAYRVRTVKLAQFRKSLATAVVFRAAPVQVVPMADPATLQPYAGFDFLETKSMATPQEFKVESAGGTHVCFVPPDSRLFFTFKKGQRSNPNLMEVRAFALGSTGATEGQDIAGEGYFAADTPSITNIELDAALSMAQVNARRVRLQERHGMVDDMVLAYSGRASRLAQEAEALGAAGRMAEARRTASESLAYSSNIHPVIRKNASDAVVGILFYLFLAIPFALFLERLLIGHPDLRVQIAAQGGIFVLFFLVLRAVHPAVELVRSSYMILLGFITFALAALVSIFVAGRFSKNVRELNRRFQERAEAADVSRAGAAATAFLLGLSNLRKRPVRTGLTVGALILTTFAMLCFASVSSDLVDIEFPLGKAPYAGLLIRDRGLKDIGGAVGPLRELYGEDHVVAPREWAGSFSVAWGKSPEAAAYTVAHTVREGEAPAEPRREGEAPAEPRREGEAPAEPRAKKEDGSAGASPSHGASPSRVGRERTYEGTVNAVLGLSRFEPKVTPVEGAFEVLCRWFDSDTEEACFLPRPLADQLRLDDAEVKGGKTAVTLSGRKYTVLGIFDPNRLDAIVDLDGQSILPMDVVSMRNPPPAGATASSQESTDIPEDVPRLPAGRVVITPTEAMPARTQTGSVAVAFQSVDYRAARELIGAHLERSAVPAYYGLDGTAFYGGKFRMQSVEGILDLLLPIVIAALTVLNTMRGSVYERQGELYVFNAVGLSPNHIRALFLAEASVYAVVGAMGGYLLAQGVGGALKALGWTAGLTMNYSSLASVLVSVVLIAVVLLSSLYPARMAARLAAPAESLVRERQTAEGDAMELDLPFTFNRRDRVAVVPYFVDWFDNYGEGSSGEFFCSPPQCGIREVAWAVAPFVETTTWLKPYDLGVSQTVTLVVRQAPGANDNVATVVMTRKSGDRDSWERCAHAFIGLLRKRFLTWRAIPDEERERLLERGRRMLEEAIRNA